MLLEGLFIPLTTPFYPNGRLNPRKLEDNVLRYSKTPAAGLAVLSAAGQPSLLSDMETRDTMRTLAETAASEKVLLAGVARDSVRGTLELIDYAAEAGFDGALVPVPWLLRGASSSAKTLLTFYQTVADRAALPVVLDSGQVDTGEIPPGLTVELAQHSNVLGMVDSSTDAMGLVDVLRGTAGIRRDVTVTNVFAAVTGRMLKKNQPLDTILLSAASLTGTGTTFVAVPSLNTLKTRTKAVGFQLLCGRTASVLDSLMVGAAGAMVPLAAAAPQACYEVLAAWKDGDPALAEEKQGRLRMLARTIEEEMGVAGIKFGCDLNGYFGGRPRSPELPLTRAQQDEVERLMRVIRN